jgi:hypothetical protein
MGIKKQAGNGRRPSGMEEHCIGSQGPQRTAAREEQKEKSHTKSKRTNVCMHYLTFVTVKAIIHEYYMTQFGANTNPSQLIPADTHVINA